MKPLNGKIALITGSGRGIGRAIALKFAREGARVIVNDLDEAMSQAVVNEIRQSGGVASSHAGDVTHPDFGNHFVESAITTYGGLDIIVNNAGYTWDNVIQKMSDEQWYSILDCHLTAPFRILRAAQPMIKKLALEEKQSGRVTHRKVVNISSISGLSGNAGQANYSTAKAGVIGLTMALAKEWGRLNVNVNCVAFGLIQTRLTTLVDGHEPDVIIGEKPIKIGVNSGFLTHIEENTPLGRTGTPEDAANAVYLLCTPESDFITGQTILCSGGFTG